MIDANHHLAVANSFNNYSYYVDSEILRWEWDTGQNKATFGYPDRQTACLCLSLSQL